MSKKKKILLSVIASIVIAATGIILLFVQSKQENNKQIPSIPTVPTVSEAKASVIPPVEPVSHDTGHPQGDETDDPEETDPHGEIWIDLSEPNNNGHDPTPKVVGEVSIIPGVKGDEEP